MRSLPWLRAFCALLSFVVVLALGMAGCTDDPSTAAGLVDSGLADVSSDTATGSTAVDGSTPETSTSTTDGATEAGSVDVSIDGTKTPITVQGKRTFTAAVTGSTNGAVTWSVIETNGGAITSAGEYTAPASAGTFTIVATSVADATKSASVSIKVVAAPIVTMTAPTVATTGTTGLVAAVPAQVGATYAWTIGGGTITAGAGTNAITFTAGAPGSLTLSCVVTNEAGTSATGNASLAVESVPVASISAPVNVTTGDTGLVATVPAQGGATYAWTIAGGTITNGVGTASITFTAGAPGTVTLGVTVTVAGTPVTGSASVNVFAEPAVPAITALGAVTAGVTGLTASVAAQAGVTYSWALGGGSITAGQGTNTITYTAGAPGLATLSCIVTNGAGKTATASKDVTVVAAPSPLVFTAPAYVTASTSGHIASVPAEAGLAYQWTIAGGTIASPSDQVSIAFSAGAAVGPLTLGCTATNAAGTSVVGSVVVTVVASPVVSITAPATVTVSSTGNVASVVAQSNATYAWTILNGTITGGDGTNAITFSAGTTSPVTIHCTVTNQAGQSADGSASVIVLGTGTLVVTVTNPPANASIVVTGPGGYTSAAFSATTTLTNLLPGNYTITAPNRVSGGRAYAATVTGSPAVVSGGATNASVSYVDTNTPPTISVIANQTVTAGSATPAIAFTINDAEDPLGTLAVTGAVTLTPGLGCAITFGGANGDRTMTLTPGATAGVRQMTITVTDSQGATTKAVFYLTADSPVGSTSPIVTNANADGAGSLQGVSAAVPAATIITFAPSLFGQTITLDRQLNLPRSVTILSPGPDLIHIAGNGYVPVVWVTTGTLAKAVSLIGLTIRDGGAAYSPTYAAVNASGNVSLTISRCVFTNNTSDNGSLVLTGGIVGGAASLDISDSTFSGNTLIGARGVVVLFGRTTIRNATFVDNLQLGDGASTIYQFSGDLYVTNSTIASMKGGLAEKGAVQIDSGTAHLSHSTILADPNYPPGYGFGIRFAPNVLVELRNTIIAQLYPLEPSAYPVITPVASLGGNVFEIVPDSYSGPLITPAVGDQLGVPVGIDPFGSYGGSTQTVRLQSGSNALDKIPTANCLDATGVPLTTDQRGFPRPAGAHCDVGAFERQSTD